MPTRDTAWPAGTPCWVDLMADDQEKARAFYSGLFGWDIQSGNEDTGGYMMATVDQRPVAGIGGKDGEDPAPSRWTTYLATDDIDSTAKKVVEAGGRLHMDPFDVMDFGRMTVGVDPAGAEFGIWQAGTHTGAQRYNEPGAYAWNENLSRDVDANKAFYADVFGYGYQDMGGEEFSYFTFNIGADPIGGIGQLPDDVPAGVPANWKTYFVVADADATIAKLEELGGSVVTEPEDTPFGRMATVADDQGAIFAIMGQPQGQPDA